jgi:hypothetical protein
MLAGFCVFALVGCGGTTADNKTGTPSSPTTVEKKLNGTFTSVHGETGQVSFGVTFTSPPKVNIIDGLFPKAEYSTIILETTTTGFKWKNTGASNEFDGPTLRWEASGTVKK